MFFSFTFQQLIELIQEYSRIDYNFYMLLSFIQKTKEADLIKRSAS